jgi:N-acetyl-anhydromuramyl-L-alanine amidase AmpD
MIETKDMGNGGRLINPNPNGNTIIPMEDLFIYVKLVARTSNRSIITGDDKTGQVIVEQELRNVPENTNYTFPGSEGKNARDLTTEWTDIGGGTLGGGGDVGGFGITGIDITFTASFQPQITINFVDIRGATLFEQGPCSPYASFFHMPYPVFELTVKGFYGKPVTYILALKQFNTKFNSATGNFEIKCDFLGYTYAFLADVVMGYAIAAPGMQGGEAMLQSVWDEMVKTQENGGKPEGTDIFGDLNNNGEIDNNEVPIENKMSSTAISIRKMLTDAKGLEKIIGELKNTSKFQRTTQLSGLKNQVIELNGKLKNIREKWETLGVGGDIYQSTHANSGKYLLRVPATKLAITGITKTNLSVPQVVTTLIKEEFGSNDQENVGFYEAQLNAINTNPVRADKTFGLPKMLSIKAQMEGHRPSPLSKTDPIQNGFTPWKSNEDKEFGDPNKKYYWVDLGELKRQNDIFLSHIDSAIDKNQVELTSIVNQVVRDVLGFVPTVRNVTMILMANMEVFLRLLVQSSIAAEKLHDGNDEKVSELSNNTIGGMSADEGVVGDGVNEKVYSWPTYYQKKSNKSGAPTPVETYPGENSKFYEWEEVKFVEDFLKSYLTVVEDIKIEAGNVEGVPGFSNYVPMNPFESPLFFNLLGNVPCAYFRDGAQTADAESTVLRNAGQRAFLVGDYTLANPLFLWKSRISSTDTTTGTNVVPQSLSGVTGSILLNTATEIGNVLSQDVMTQMGVLDGINAINTIQNASTITSLTTAVNRGDANTSIKERMITELKKDSGGNPQPDYFKSRSFSDWHSDPKNGHGTTLTNAKAKLEKIAPKMSDSNVLTYSDKIPMDGKEGTGGNRSLLLTANPNDTNTTTILDNGGTYDSKIIIDGDNKLIERIDKNSGGSIQGYENGYRKGASALTKEMLGLETKGDPGALTLDENIFVASSDEKFNKRFLSLNEYDEDQVVYSFGEIQSIDNTGLKNDMQKIDFGSPWNTSETYDTLITTPLWAKNLSFNGTNGPINYRQPSFKSYIRTNQLGAQPTEGSAYRAQAFLTLITMGKTDDSSKSGIDGIGFGGWYDSLAPKTIGKSVKSILPFFRETGHATTVPKGFIYLTGAILWRLRESGYLSEGTADGLDPEGSDGNGTPYPWGPDPIYWPDETNSYGVINFDGYLQEETIRESLVEANGDVNPGTLTNILETPHMGNTNYSGGIDDSKGFKKFEPYHWPHTYQTNDKDDLTNAFCFIKSGSDFEYVDIREEMKSLLLLPTQTKKDLINEFIKFADGNFKTKYSPTFDPLHAHNGAGIGTVNIFDTYALDGTTETVLNFILKFSSTIPYEFSTAGVIGPKNKKSTGAAEGLWDELTNSGELDNTENIGVRDMLTDVNDIMVWGTATPKAFSAVYRDDISDEFNLPENYFDNFVNGWIEGVKLASKQKVKEQQANPGAGLNAMEDNDVKLSLYTSFKSLFDKWISRSQDDGGGNFKLFYNQVSNNKNPNRLLIDHFQFVDRAFNDVGNKAVIDITQLLSLVDTPTQSLYQTMSEMLSKNNFDFHPLPNFVDYSKESDEDLNKMFEPVVDLSNINSSPSFVCMYVGGTSTSLDIGPLASATCGPNNKIAYSYEGDGVRLGKVANPQDINDGGSGVTAFVVEYGRENQSHFKSINLNQAEFKETQESLMVIDQLAKGGNDANRSSKGQNLFNVYQTRSYTCEVETMGNMMIQPMMYFQLENVPMFWGAYLITKVKHNVKPHYVTTTFTGVRVPRIVTPLVTDAMSSMNIGASDPTKNGGDTDEYRSKINPNNSNAISEIESGGPETIESTAISDKVVDGIKVRVGKQYQSAGTLDSSKVTSVVLHWTAGWNFHVNESTSVGYQFEIDKNGDLYQTNDVKNKSSHAGCPSSKTGPCHSMNSTSVGVSYVGGLKYHQKLGVPGIVDGVHNFADNKQDNKIHGYAFTDEEWKKSEVYLPYNEKGGKARTLKVNPKAQWDSIVNAILLAKSAHPTITNIVSHHWISRDKQDVRDEFPWARLINELRTKGFTEARIVKDWPSTNNHGKGKTVYDKKLNVPESAFGPQAQEDQGNK